MISAKQLTDEQVGRIRAWAEEGAQLQDIQLRMKSELDLNATFMDTRFLILDLGIELKVEEVEEEPVPAEEVPGGMAAGFSVALDEVTQAGAMVSGRIQFSDGEKGYWMIDQMGRPGLDTDTPGYQPSEEDMMAFERELRRLLGQ